MSNYQNLRAFMSSKSIAPDVVERSLKIRWEGVNESNAEGVHKKLDHLLGVKLDNSIFVKVARKHGYDESLIKTAKEVDTSEAVKAMNKANK